MIFFNERKNFALVRASKALLQRRIMLISFYRRSSKPLTKRIHSLPRKDFNQNMNILNLPFFLSYIRFMFWWNDIEAQPVSRKSTRKYTIWYTYDTFRPTNNWINWFCCRNLDSFFSYIWQTNICIYTFIIVEELYMLTNEMILVSWNCKNAVVWTLELTV